MIDWLTVEGCNCPPPQRVLGPEERACYEALRSEKRQRDWLLGRAAAKRLVLRHLGARGARLPPAAIRVISDPDGAPRVAPAGLALADTRLCAELLAMRISISHTGGRSLCALLGGRAVGLGADIEQVAPRGAGFADAYYTAAELALLGAAPAASYDTLSTAIWSAKEATLKFTRHGLRVDTRSVICLPAPLTGGGWAPVAITTELTSAPLKGWWRASDGYVITIIVGVGGGGAPEGGAHPSPRPFFSDEDEQCRTISIGYGR
jgi:phosphopantetheinyl transferase